MQWPQPLAAPGLHSVKEAERESASWPVKVKSLRAGSQWGGLKQVLFSDPDAVRGAEPIQIRACRGPGSRVCFPCTEAGTTPVRKDQAWGPVISQVIPVAAFRRKGVLEVAITEPIWRLRFPQGEGHCGQKEWHVHGLQARKGVEWSQATAEELVHHLGQHFAKKMRCHVNVSGSAQSCDHTQIWIPPGQGKLLKNESTTIICPLCQQ